MKFFGDLDTYNQIMGCSASLECKSFSHQIRNVDTSRWDSVAGKVYHPGIRSKFLQWIHYYKKLDANRSSNALQTAYGVLDYPLVIHHVLMLVNGSRKESWVRS